MKKTTLLLAFLFVTGIFSGKVYTKEILNQINNYPFYVYYDNNSSLNNFYPTKMLGDYRNIEMTYNFKKAKFTGSSSIKLTYSTKKKSVANWSGIFWQNLSPQLAGMTNGYNLSGAKKLHIFARGNSGNEVVEFRIGLKNTPNSDSCIKNSGVIKLSKTWKKYTITIGKEDLSSILNGFGVIINAGQNPNGCTIYLDKIYYSK